MVLLPDLSNLFKMYANECIFAVIIDIQWVKDLPSLLLLNNVN